MSISRSLVNNFISQKKGGINNEYRLRYHMSCDVGWMNDPNGLIYFNDAYHFYYQAYPYRTKPGQMMWGHFVSKDMITFEDRGIALSLDTLGENAYSGNAINIDGKLNIFYTLHTEKHPQIIRYDGEVTEPYVEEVLDEDTNEAKKHLPMGKGQHGDAAGIPPSADQVRPLGGAARYDAGRCASAWRYLERAGAVLVPRVVGRAGLPSCARYRAS